MLRASGVTKVFDDVTALDSVDFTLNASEIHALLGENGAGKSTLGNVIAGIYRADAGSIAIDGAVVEIHSPLDAIRAGVGMVHQHFRLVEVLTAAENLHLGWPEAPKYARTAVLNRRMEEACEQFGIHVRPDAPVWQLSVGERQRLEILRVLARGARVLILDEPTAVLTPGEVDGLFAALRGLRAQGRSVVFVSHKLNEVLALCDRVTVLRRGRVVGVTSANEVDATGLARLMTGEQRAEAARREGSAGTAPSLSLTGVSARGSHGLVALHDVSLTVYEREIVGIAGVSGNGQAELGEVASGLRRPDAGRVNVGEADLTGASAKEFAAHGVGNIPPDRLESALARGRSVLENALLREYDHQPLSRRRFLNGTETKRFAESLIADADVRGADNLGLPVGYLSGGNQQKLVAHRETRVASRVLVASLPTRGLDIAATRAIRNLILSKRNAGLGIVLISEDLDEVLELSDRICVMYDGRIVGEYASENADRGAIGLLMGGGRVPGESAEADDR